MNAILGRCLLRLLLHHHLLLLLLLVLPLPLVLSLPLLQPHKLGEPLNVDLRRALDWHRRARPAPQEAAEGCEASGGQVHGHDALLLSHPSSLLLTEQCRHSGGARHDAWSEHIRTNLSRQPPPELRRARSRRHVTDWPRP